MFSQELTAAEYRIYNVEDWAENFLPGAGRPPFYISISFDNNFASVYERVRFLKRVLPDPICDVSIHSVTIEHFEEGYRTRNVGTGFWACSYNGEVVSVVPLIPRDQFTDVRIGRILRLRP